MSGLNYMSGLNKIVYFKIESNKKLFITFNNSFISDNIAKGDDIIVEDVYEEYYNPLGLFFIAHKVGNEYKDILIPREYRNSGSYISEDIFYSINDLQIEDDTIRWYCYAGSAYNNFIKASCELNTITKECYVSTYPDYSTSYPTTLSLNYTRNVSYRQGNPYTYFKVRFSQSTTNPINYLSQFKNISSYLLNWKRDEDSEYNDWIFEANVYDPNFFFYEDLYTFMNVFNPDLDENIQILDCDFYDINECQTLFLFAHISKGLLNVYNKLSKIENIDYSVNTFSISRNYNEELDKIPCLWGGNVFDLGESITLNNVGIVLYYNTNEMEYNFEVPNQYSKYKIAGCSFNLDAVVNHNGIAGFGIKNILFSYDLNTLEDNKEYDFRIYLYDGTNYYTYKSTYEFNHAINNVKFTQITIDDYDDEYYNKVINFYIEYEGNADDRFNELDCVYVLVDDGEISFQTDYGVRLNSQISLPIDLSSLSGGEHTLTIRGKLRERFTNDYYINYLNEAKPSQFYTETVDEDNLTITYQYSILDDSDNLIEDVSKYKILLVDTDTDDTMILTESSGSLTLYKQKYSKCICASITENDVEILHDDSLYVDSFSEPYISHDYYEYQDMGMTDVNLELDTDYGEIVFGYNDGIIYPPMNLRYYDNDLYGNSKTLIWTKPQNDVDGYKIYYNDSIIELDANKTSYTFDYVNNQEHIIILSIKDGMESVPNSLRLVSKKYITTYSDTVGGIGGPDSTFGQGFVIGNKLVKSVNLPRSMFNDIRCEPYYITKDNFYYIIAETYKKSQLSTLKELLKAEDVGINGGRLCTIEDAKMLYNTNKELLTSFACSSPGYQNSVNHKLTNIPFDKFDQRVFQDGYKDYYIGKESMEQFNNTKKIEYNMGNNKLTENDVLYYPYKTYTYLMCEDGFFGFNNNNYKIETDYFGDDSLGVVLFVKDLNETGNPYANIFGQHVKSAVEIYGNNSYTREIYTRG